MLKSPCASRRNSSRTHPGRSSPRTPTTPLIPMARRRRRTSAAAPRRARRRPATVISRPRVASRRRCRCPIPRPASPRCTTRVPMARARMEPTDVPPRRAAWAVQMAEVEHPTPGVPMRSEPIPCPGRRTTTSRARPACSPRVTIPTTGVPLARAAGTGSGNGSGRGRRSVAIARIAIGTPATIGREMIRDRTVDPTHRTSTSCPRSASIPGRWFASTWTTTRIRSTKAQNTSVYLTLVLSSTILYSVHPFEVRFRATQKKRFSLGSIRYFRLSRSPF